MWLIILTGTAIEFGKKGFGVHCILHIVDCTVYQFGKWCMLYAVIAVVNWLTVLMYLLTVNKWWHVDTFMVWPIKLQMVHVCCSIQNENTQQLASHFYIRWNRVHSYAFKLDYFCDAMSPSILFIFNRLDRIKFDRVGNQTTGKHLNQSNDSLLTETEMLNVFFFSIYMYHNMCYPLER